MILRDISELLKTIERMEQMDDYNKGEKNIIRWVHSELISAPYLEWNKRCEEEREGE